MKNRKNLLVIVAVLEVVLAYTLCFALVKKLPPFLFSLTAASVFLVYQFLLFGVLQATNRKMDAYSLFRIDYSPMNIICSIPIIHKRLKTESLQLAKTHARQAINEQKQLPIWTLGVMIFAGWVKYWLIVMPVLQIALEYVATLAGYSYGYAESIRALPFQMFFTALLLAIVFTFYAKRGPLKGHAYRISGTDLLLPIFGQSKNRRIPLAQIQSVDMQWNALAGYYISFRIEGREKPLIHSANFNTGINWPAIKADIEGHLPQNQPEPEYA